MVGAAGDGTEAVELAAELDPDVVLMDLHMPGMNGIDATRAVTAARPETAVLVLTMLEGDDSVFAAMRAGARGYLLKGADRAEIGRAIESVARGGVVFSSGVAERVLGYFAAGSSSQPLQPFPELTDREREVLDLVARGLTNAEIARRLRALGQDGAQPRQQRLRQAACRRAGRSSRPSAGRRPRVRLSRPSCRSPATMSHALRGARLEPYPDR